MSEPRKQRQLAAHGNGGHASPANSPTWQTRKRVYGKSGKKCK